MKMNMKRFVVITGVGLALIMPICTALADSLGQLSAQWWQWALSIPTSVNPQLDLDGKNVVVGQRGSVWFLAGIFGGGTVTRTCSVPEGTQLFFPVTNQVEINTPNVCGQTGTLSVKDLRAMAAAVINGATELSLTVDGNANTNLQRVRSEVFAVALPAENVFDAPCKGAGLGDVPAGIYSPAVDDGFYVLLNPLPLGHHVLRFHAKAGGIEQDVTYDLTVVPVSPK